MDILIPDEWLREYLITNAKPSQIMRYLSLCGPTVDRLQGKRKDTSYQIEVTTNRVDSASVLGIAREAAAILPRFGFTGRLKKIPQAKLSKFKKLDFHIKNNSSLCKRILAIKLSNVVIKDSPDWMKKRLEATGQRPLNNIIDITNYVMWEVGHPVHVFDYDKLTEKTIVVREADCGESLINLDGKKHILFGGEVVFDDGTGEIIDLPGIMGTKNSVVGPTTKNILLWIESVDAVKIRQASMAHMIRTQAAILNEKSVDPELGLTAILRAVDLYKKLANAQQSSDLFDLNETPFKTKVIKLNKGFIDKLIGVSLPKKDIKEYLTPLGFDVSWHASELQVRIPSYRAYDINIPEDVVEEIARIYGYHNLPSELMSGKIPGGLANPTFSFELKLKNLLSGWGGVEVYNYSLVPADWVEKNALKVANPLGTDSEYLRTNLRSSLMASAKANSGERDPFHIFEIANVYIPKKGNLPDEKMYLAGIFSNYDYRAAKGIIEALLTKLNINYHFAAEDSVYFEASKRVNILADSSKIGEFGVLDEGNYIYYEFEIEKLKSVSKPISRYIPLPKYPPQIEDLTLILPEKTRVGEVISSIKSQDKLIYSVELTEIFKDSYTFRIQYLDARKTLTDKEVEEIRNKILTDLKKKFGVTQKS